MTVRDENKSVDLLTFLSGAAGEEARALLAKVKT